jgi:tRNA(Ile)-lysidine synthase
MFLLKVSKSIKKYSLFEKGDSVVIACSGGIDSVSLFHVMVDLKKEWKFDLIVAHYNHKLRREADEDQEFVRRLASDYSLPFYSESGDVKAFAQNNRMNLEEAGRELRYEFLRKISRKYGLAKIATGHTMTDQAETILMRILRGTGSHGLGGMRPKTKEGLVRPFIFVKREDVLRYVKRKGIKYRVDESNFNTDFLRNKIRHRLIPYLENNYSPHIIEHLSRLALIVQEEDLFLKEFSREKLDLAEVLIKRENRLDLDFLHTQPKALQRRMLRDYILNIRGSLREISYKDIHSIMGLDRGKQFRLEQGLVLKNEGGLIGVKKESQSVEYEYSWTGKIPLEIKEIGMVVKGVKIARPLFFEDFDDRANAFLDNSKLHFPLIIRNRQPGDHYRPLGTPGSQKIKELMRDRRIPRELRERYPVFLSENEIIWVCGLPVSEKYRVTDSTQNIFKIEIDPLKSKIL